MDRLRVAQEAMAAGDWPRARLLLSEEIAARPDHAPGHFLLGRVEGSAGNADRRLALCERAVALDPTNPESRAELGRCYLAVGRADDALAAAEAAAADPAADPLALDAAAAVQAGLNRHDQAASLLRRAVDRGGDSPAILFNLATALKFCGDLSGADAALRRAIAIAPSHVKSRAALSALRTATPQANQIDAYRALLRQVRDPAARLQLCHGAATECDLIGRYDEAMAFLREGKAGMIAATGGDDGQDRRLFAALHAGFAAGAPPGDGLRGPRPIFITGMPRSGTTVVERIVSAAPSVGSVGESLEFGAQLRRRAGVRTNHLIDPASVPQLLARDDFEDIGRAYLAALSALGPGADRALDKFHLNVLLAGFIGRALPDARIVCVVRGAMDTILGNYRQLLEYRSGLYRYTLSLEACAHFYVGFRRLADLWAKIMPDRFRIISYEALVADPEPVARELIAFCGLDWDPRYLRIEANDGPVTSASAVQVRSALNARSVGHWRHYRRHLTGAEAIVTAAGIAL